MKTKSEIRKQIKQILSDIDKETYNKKSQSIHNLLFESDAWKNSNCIATTVSGAIEIDTLPIIRKGWEEGKHIVVPKCISEQKRLEFREINSFEQLETVFYGLKEPVVSNTRLVGKQEIELVIVPGLAFSHHGYRIGFGGGYYDRFLADYEGEKVALALEEQLFNTLPFESYDIPVNYVITPTKVIRC